MPIIHQPGRKNPWIARYYIDDTLVPQEKWCRTRPEAELALFHNCGEKSKKDFLSFCCETALELFKTYELGRGRDPDKVRSEDAWFRQHLVKRFCDRALSTLTEEDFALLLTDLEAKHSPSSVYLWTCRIIRFMGHAFALGLMTRHVAWLALDKERQRPPAAIRVARTPTKSEQTRLDFYSSPVELVMLRLLLRTRVRLNEMPRLTWPDVDFVKHRLFVRDLVLLGDDPDNPEGRWVPMTSDLEAALLWWMFEQRRRWPGRLHVFFSPNGAASASNMTQLLSDLQVRCGILAPIPKDEPARAARPRYRSENFAHVAAITWCRQGRHIKELELLTGLTVITIEDLYGKFIEDED